ncbi:hypothetical protein Tco_1255650 [Tanacetum coccineum]
MSMKSFVPQDKIKQWSNNIKTLERNRKTVALEEINSIEKRIDEGSAMPFDNDHRLILLQEIEKIDKFASMDIIQKAHVKWDIEGDKNSNSTMGLTTKKGGINDQWDHGLRKLDTNPWIDQGCLPSILKRNSKLKIQQGFMFSTLPHSHSLIGMDRKLLKDRFTLEKTKDAV